MTRDLDGADTERPAPAEPGSVAAQGEGFVSRWSRRKREARAGVIAPGADAGEAPDAGLVPESDSPLPHSTAPPADSPTHPPAEPVPPPPLESLDGDSDYSAFLSPKVSEELRRLALRKLFGSSKFNLRDGLDDYDDDYRIFASLGDIVPAHMRRRMDLTSAQGEPPPSAEQAPVSGAPGEVPDDREQAPVNPQDVGPDGGGDGAEQSAPNAHPRDRSVGDET